MPLRCFPDAHQHAAVRDRIHFSVTSLSNPTSRHLRSVRIATCQEAVFVLSFYGVDWTRAYPGGLYWLKECEKRRQTIDQRRCVAVLPIFGIDGEFDGAPRSRY